jgi:hypothetical protein
MQRLYGYDMPGNIRDLCEIGRHHIHGKPFPEFFVRNVHVGDLTR